MTLLLLLLGENLDGINTFLFAAPNVGNGLLECIIDGLNRPDLDLSVYKVTSSLAISP